MPPQANGEFVWRMEDVLDVHHRPYDPKRPLICLDEASKQLLADTREPLPMIKKHPLKIDHEYERHQVCSRTQKLTTARIQKLTAR